MGMTMGMKMGKRIWCINERRDNEYEIKPGRLLHPACPGLVFLALSFFIVPVRTA